MPESLKINNQVIAWSFFWKVVKKYGLRKAQEIFFLCRYKNKIINYISGGMVKGWFSVDIYRSEDVEAFIRQHFDKRIPPEPVRKGKQKVTSIKDILNDIR